ncbi:orotidine-5'-phosphate decarboxylase [Candidatus Desantisbacteria bacterium CG_4_10_14_0_8_um_filter_48_22]|uniref:Orotidine 5'-phosphate decarboxylase n=1 Tax=Candidatus Desantisbacteria bacterium CG_4_10_14_0_8_um_filter_48_22 TaxID=1974543 RepID=A0A2M7S8F6_9BACT|nr:MAG: orotidine 5'-phosphate decarboxylase [Candidatus Desantisbacteria bacterium CG1_02_49_89]PIV57268.1 MAG: orotidine-5'-phosphate decarboxylase [Candidatus Desantisbacteria bacterium CG02_land_8_20_14_3_00_49_13]PIZ15603.1 MAG: orotidine-5'-phosphate decarboxylase [Candidatus Desantisbacteria bacterium CG_4_10_14_0_8_um_filter_48_22]
MKNNPLIVALDVKDYGAAKKFVAMLKDCAGMFKIGSILFTKEGPGIVEMVKKFNKKVFLDLKYHDIPNTVGMAVRSALSLGVDMLTVHAGGGTEMMREAAKNKGGMRVVAVTVLTSIDGNILKKELGINRGVERQVVALARLAKSCGLDGVVASGREIKTVRKACGRNFLIVVPGVRPAAAETGDQKRVVTPRDAVGKGADFIVVGRPILEAADPVSAAVSILKEIG